MNWSKSSNWMLLTNFFFFRFHNFDWWLSSLILFVNPFFLFRINKKLIIINMKLIIYCTLFFKNYFLYSHYIQILLTSEKIINIYLSCFMVINKEYNLNHGFSTGIFFFFTTQFKSFYSLLLYIVMLMSAKAMNN